MGTSEIVILTVNAILKKFEELGYSEDDVSVYYWKWMSANEMIQDERMNKVNCDVISYVQKLEKKLWNK